MIKKDLYKDPAMMKLKSYKGNFKWGWGDEIDSEFLSVHMNDWYIIIEKNDFRKMEKFLCLDFLSMGDSWVFWLALSTYNLKLEIEHISIIILAEEFNKTWNFLTTWESISKHDQINILFDSILNLKRLRQNARYLRRTIPSLKHFNRRCSFPRNMEQHSGDFFIL